MKTLIFKKKMSELDYLGSLRAYERASPDERRSRGLSPTPERIYGKRALRQDELTNDLTELIKLISNSFNETKLSVAERYDWTNALKVTVPELIDQLLFKNEKAESVLIPELKVSKTAFKTLNRFYHQTCNALRDNLWSDPKCEKSAVVTNTKTVSSSIVLVDATLTVLVDLPSPTPLVKSFAEPSNPFLALIRRDLDEETASSSPTVPNILTVREAASRVSDRSDLALQTEPRSVAPSSPEGALYQEAYSPLDIFVNSLTIEGPKKDFGSRDSLIPRI